MADLSQTAANVGVGGPCSVEVVQVGEAVTQGMPGYLSSSGKYMKAANTSEAAAECDGIFMTPAGANGYSVIAKGDGAYINLGATLTVGTTYAVSGSGAICPIADVGSGEWKTTLGEGYSSSLLKTKFNRTRIQVA